MRLIDADALKEYIQRSVPNWSEDREIALDCIANSPTIEERKKGKWIKGNDGYIRCSECGCRASAIKARFCHRCGADMRGEE